MENRNVIFYGLWKVWMCDFQTLLFLQLVWVTSYSHLTKDHAKAGFLAT